MPRTVAAPARQRQSVKADWDKKEAAELERALASRPDALGYCELAGFFFALACAPQLVKPSEWLPVALGGAPPESGEEARRLIELVMALYNHINLQVLEREPSLPAAVEVRLAPMENFGPHAPLGRWAAGFGAGQLFVEEIWQPFVDEGADAETIDATLGRINVALSFFTNRELAGTWLQSMPANPTLEEGARRALEAVDVSMKALAELGRGLEERSNAEQTAPPRRAKVGRNEACPCGSGRKYKHCCGR